MLTFNESLPILSITGSIASITLNRPSQRNSLNDDDLRCLLAHFAQINADSKVRVLVLTANTSGQSKPVFSAGYNVSGFDSGQHDPNFFEKIPDALEKCRPLTICALNGSVYGGATDLLLACDIRLGLVNTEFRMPACALGLHYYPSGLQRYVSRLGLNAAKRAFLTAQTLKIEYLHTLGLFEELLEPQQFDAAVQAWANKLAQLAPLAAQLTKQSLNELAAGQCDMASMREREALTNNSQDFKEGRQAFLERRPATFIRH
jgi:enoyl-CoA hydratase/carnithine racemase